MNNSAFDILEKLSEHEELKKLFHEEYIPSKTLLLREGEIATKLYFIKKGCLRMWVNKDGKDITLQFFFQNQCVASIDSLINHQPSIFSLESLEPCVLLSLKKKDLDFIHDRIPEIKEKFRDILYERFRNYAQLFLSRIKDTPQERYEELIRSNKDIVTRIPQRYIASYLGITPVSLSRIRNRK